MVIISLILLLVAVYLACGFIFAIVFVLKGVDKVDEGAHGSGWGFRLIIIPGVMVFWPILLGKWMKAKPQSHDETTS